MGAGDTTLQCSGCGATLAFKDAALSLRCAYCDSPMVDEQRARASIEKVVPFALPARGALERVRTYLDSRWLAPADLRRTRIDARGLRGVLVPFWVYSATIRSEYRARVGIDWYRKVKKKDKEGKQVVEQVRETQWFRLEGSAGHQVEDHLVSASVGLSAEETGMVGTFDLGHVRAYDARILSGFEAELPSRSARGGDRQALSELREAERARVLAELLPGDRNRIEDIHSEVRLGERQLVLLPVWILTYHYRDEVRRVLVNGQSGEVGGRVPVDKWKVAGLVLAVLVIGALVWLLRERLQGRLVW